MLQAVYLDGSISVALNFKSHRRVLFAALFGLFEVSLLLASDQVARAATVSIGRLRPLHNLGLCLDIPNPSGVWPSTSYPASGTPVSIYGCHGNPNQLWSIEELGHEMYRIRSAWSNQCLAIAAEAAANNVQVQIATCSSPSTTFMRQTFALIHRAPVVGGTGGDFELRSGVRAPGAGLSYCVEVPNSNGAGSLIGTWRCPSGSLLQPNQGWRVDLNPSSESGSAQDGEIASAIDAYPSQVGQLWTYSGGPFCSASSVSGGLSAAVVVTARHCVENQSPDVWFGAKWDVRRPGVVTGFFHADAYLLVPIGVGSSYQDVAFLRTGGMYNSNGSWNGATLNAAVGRFGIAFGPMAVSTVMYTYGYPANIVDSRAPNACANPISFSAANINEFQLDCQSTGGNSGSPWMAWGTTTVRAVSHAIFAPTFTSLTGGNISVVQQVHPFFNSAAYSVWLGV